MKRALTVIFGLFLVLVMSGIAPAAEQDVPGGKDYPLLSRMPDFHITADKETAYNSYRFIGHDKKALYIEGHTFYLEYKLNKGAPEPGELKIRRNVQEALKKIGGTVVFDDNFNRVSTIVLHKNGREIWFEVRSYNNMYRLNIVEKEVMKQEIVANAAAMGTDLSSNGHVPVYGIYFDTGKAIIKPESEAAIAEIAKLLNANTALSIYVVGHTDNVGTFDANMKLSKERAEAVAKALVTDHGIAAARLKPYGVGPLAPVAANDTEDGKAKNRRVELVLR